LPSTGTGLARYGRPGLLCNGKKLPLLEARLHSGEMEVLHLKVYEHFEEDNLRRFLDEKN